MKLSPRERAMLREMGVAWPEGVDPAVEPVQAEPLAGPRPAARAQAAVAIESERGSPVTEVKAAPVSRVAAPTHRKGSEPMAEPAASAGPANLGEPWPQQANWEELQAAVASCKRCGLCAQRRHTVFGVGHPRAAWMVVGEAPGEQEDRQGEPFVGAAGQLLDRMLASIGLSRAQQVFITNTVKCRPPQNRNPEPSELAACAPVLQRQMELVQPRLVLAMGRFAAQQLLRTEEPIGRLRGRVHRLPGFGAGAEGDAGVPVVVTYHPAYLLRNPIDKAKAWDDLCLALDTMAALSTGR